MSGLQYTVGGGQRPDAWFIRLPWHLRGTGVELMDGCRAIRAVLPPGCVGYEFRDDHVQVERHRFPWCEEVSDDGADREVVHLGGSPEDH